LQTIRISKLPDAKETVSLKNFSLTVSWSIQPHLLENHCHGIARTPPDSHKIAQEDG
jgi:hypothetical protein